MRKNVKKLAVVFLAVCLCMTALVGCKAKTDPDLWVENPSGVAAEDLTLSDEQMVAALTELARRTENQMLAVEHQMRVKGRRGNHAQNLTRSRFDGHNGTDFVLKQPFAQHLEVNVDA